MTNTIGPERFSRATEANGFGRQMEGRAAALDSYANNFSPDTPKNRVVKRENRLSARYWLWDHSSLKRVRFCGRYTTSTTGQVGIRRHGEAVGFAGVQSCGSVWACPVCNAKVMARRALEIGAAVESWTKAGGRVGFLTFTVRHHRGHSLEQVWAGIAKAWHRVTGGKAWKADKEKFGALGFCKVVEVTQGRNGWHVHVHALVFLDDAATAGTLRALQDSMFKRWKAGAIAGRLGALRTAQDAKLVTDDVQLSQYLAKQAHGAIGVELTSTQSKVARSEHGTRSVWTVFDQARLGLAREVDLWFEWERTSKGKRQISWSHGMRDLVGLAQEDTDETVAAEEVGTADDTIAVLSEAGWSDLVEARLLGECLRAASKNLAALHAWLVMHNIEHVMVRGTDERAA